MYSGRLGATAGPYRVESGDSTFGISVGEGGIWLLTRAPTVASVRILCSRSSSGSRKRGAWSSG